MRSRRGFLLAGLCSLASRSADAAGLPLEVLGNPYNAETYRRLTAAWSNAVHLTFTPRESDEIVRSLLLRAFTRARLPDVAFMNADVIRTFADRGLLSPVDASEAGGSQGLRIGREIYGLAYGLSVPVVAFNMALLRQAGVDEPPRDWPGILSLACRLHASGVLGGFIEHDNGGAFTFQYLLGSFGGQAMSDDERHLAFHSPAGLEALDVLRAFGECGQAGADMSRRQARRAFTASRIGVLVTMSSVLPNLRKAVHVETVPLPLMTADATVPVAGPVAVHLRSSRSAEGWPFIRFALGRQGQQILAQTSGYLPLSDAPARSTGWYTFPGRNSLKICELIQDEMQQVATLQKTPAKALDAMARAVEVLLVRRTK